MAAVNISVGSYTPTIDVQKETGERDLFQFNPFLAVGFSWRMMGNHFFVPQVGLAKDFSIDDDYGDYSKTTLFFLWDFSYLLVKGLVVRYGLGTFLTRISGDGGEVTVPNGHSTATAYRPEQAITSYSTTLNLGLEYIGQAAWANKYMGLRAEGHLFSFLDSESRSLGYTLSLVYYY